MLLPVEQHDHYHYHDLWTLSSTMSSRVNRARGNWALERTDFSLAQVLDSIRSLLLLLLVSVHFSHAFVVWMEKEKGKKRGDTKWQEGEVDCRCLSLRTGERRTSFDPPLLLLIATLTTLIKLFHSLSTLSMDEWEKKENSNRAAHSSQNMQICKRRKRASIARNESGQTVRWAELHNDDDNDNNSGNYYQN